MWGWYADLGEWPWTVKDPSNSPPPQLTFLVTQKLFSGHAVGWLDLGLGDGERVGRESEERERTEIPVP